MIDVAIQESGNGGDLLIVGNDLKQAVGITNMVYLGMFGGDDDWWANDLEAPELRLTGSTEKTLNKIALNSAGRIKVEEAVKADLAFLKKQYPDTKIIVTAIIAANDRIHIKVNLDGAEVTYLWQPTYGFLEDLGLGSGVGFWIIEFNFIVS